MILIQTRGCRAPIVRPIENALFLLQNTFSWEEYKTQGLLNRVSNDEKCNRKPCKWESTSLVVRLCRRHADDTLMMYSHHTL